MTAKLMAEPIVDALRIAKEKFDSDVAGGPLVPAVTPEQIRSYLSSRYDFSDPGNLDEISADVERMMRTWHVQVTHPRYFGLFNPSVTLASVVADTLVAMHNPQLASWRTSPAANEIERHTLSWLASKFGLPSNTAASFTSGGAEANLSAVTVALTRSFPGYSEKGLRSLPKTPTIYLSTEAHHSFNKIAHMTGLGREALRRVATDSNLKMDLADLARRVAEDRNNGFTPFMVVGNAGTTVAGVIDPLPDLARFCRLEDLWFHVDAAWGGAAVLSPTLKTHLAGIEASDSVTCDAHKWFSVPVGAGMFFCRHPDSVGETFRADNPYMPKTTDEVMEPYITSVQWSRRFIGLKLFLSLAHEGEGGCVARIEHQARMGCMLRESLKNSGWRIVNNTPLPLVCFTREGLDVPKYLAALLREQIAWMSETRVRGAAVIRACVTSYRTTEADVAWVVGEMNRIAATEGSI